MTRPSANRTVKFQMMLSEQEIKEIDDFRFGNRIATRAEAIRQLINRGLWPALIGRAQNVPSVVPDDSKKYSGMIDGMDFFSRERRSAKNG